MIKLSKQEKKYLKIGGALLLTLIAIRYALKFFPIGGGSTILTADNTGAISTYLPTTQISTSTIFEVSKGIEGKSVKSAESFEGYLEQDLSGNSLTIPAGATLGKIKEIFADSTEMENFDGLIYYIDNSSKVKYVL